MKVLLEPVEFRNGVRARNRLGLAPITSRQGNEDGSVSDADVAWLRQRAEGGFGIVTTCSSFVSRDGQGARGQLGIDDDTLIPGLSRLASTLREHGAVAVAQLYHAGLRADPALIGGRPWSASELDGEDGTRAATAGDIEGVIDAFGAAGRRAHEAGFDGVELHAAHGFLLTQFLSVVQNRRDDEWGGALENRARLVREVVRAIRARVPSSFLVGVRISPEDGGSAVGLDLDESVQVARWLVDDGADTIHLSLWRAQKYTTKRPSEHALPIFRGALDDEIVLAAAGAVWTRSEAEQLLELGADTVALGRAGILNPDWPLRVADPSWQPRRPPFTSGELREVGVTPPFLDYLRHRYGELVAD